MKSITNLRCQLNQAVALLAPYWQFEEKWQAYKLLALTLLCSVLGIRASVALNEFYKNFYDALQAFDRSALQSALLHFCLILIIIIFAYGYAVYTTGVLSARWRRWLTHRYLHRWQHSALPLKTIDNPDQRICEDLALLADNSLKILLIILEATLTLVSFAWILWQQNPYLVGLAVTYGIIGTLVTVWIGKKLTKLDYELQRVNANFRFALMQFRQKKPVIANHMNDLFTPIYNNALMIVSLKKRLAYFTSGFNTIAYVIGILCALPLYFSRQLQLGGLMQMSGAFSSVVGAFYRIVNGFEIFAQWSAVIQRLTELDQALLTDTVPPTPPLIRENPLEPATG